MFRRIVLQSGERLQYAGQGSRGGADGRGAGGVGAARRPALQPPGRWPRRHTGHLR